MCVVQWVASCLQSERGSFTIDAVYYLILVSDSELSKRRGTPRACSEHVAKARRRAFGQRCCPKKSVLSEKFVRGGYVLRGPHGSCPCFARHCSDVGETDTCLGRDAESVKGVQRRGEIGKDRGTSTCAAINRSLARRQHNHVEFRQNSESAASMIGHPTRTF